MICCTDVDIDGDTDVGIAAALFSLMLLMRLMFDMGDMLYLC